MEQIVGLVIVLTAGGAGFLLARWKLKVALQTIVLVAMAGCWILVIFADPYLHARRLPSFLPRVSGDLLTALRFSAEMAFLALPAAFIGWLGGIWLCVWERKDRRQERSPQK